MVEARRGRGEVSATIACRGRASFAGLSYPSLRAVTGECRGPASGGCRGQLDPGFDRDDDHGASATTALSDSIDDDRRRCCAPAGYICRARRWRRCCSWRSSWAGRCSSRARRASGKTEIAKVLARDAGPAADPAAVLRGPRRRRGRLRVELCRADDRDPAGRGRGRARSRSGSRSDIFAERFLIKRPLLQALEPHDRPARRCC